MKFVLISLALIFVANIDARKFDHVRKYLAEHETSVKHVHKRSAQSWLKNSNTIGLGYNPLYGSPVCYTGVCQGDGFKHAVFKLNYVQPAIGSCTNDLIPDFVELQCIPSADIQTSTETISTYEHLSDSTFKRIEFYVATRYRRHAASYFYSKETRSMIDTMTKQDSTAMYTRGDVTFGKLRMFEPFMELSDTFRYVIEQMPCCNEYSQEIDDYIKEFVIDYFGLTYVSELILGGIAQQTMFISNKQRYELEMKGEDIVQAASIGFYLNFNIQPVPPYNDIKQREFMESVQTQHSTKLGGDPSAQTMDDWIKSVPSNPVIMNYGVKDLATILTQKHFPADHHIYNKSKILDRVIQRYLDRHVPLCINNCTDSSHGVCDIANNPPFLLGTCVCRPGWKGVDCSQKEHSEPKTTTSSGTIAPHYPPSWDVQRQDGIGEMTKTTILSSLRSLIDTYGKAKKSEIAMDLKLWLDKSYSGTTWAVVIGDINHCGSAFSYAANTCLVVQEKSLDLHVIILRTD